MTEFLLSFLLRSLFLGAVGLILLMLIRRRSAALQHAVAVGTIAAMLALPLIAQVMPTKTVEVASVPEALVYLSVTKVPQTSIPTGSPEVVQQPFDWSPVVSGVWLAGSLLLMLRIGYGLHSLVRRIGRSEPVNFGIALTIREDPTARVPMMVWLKRSIILLPSTWRLWPLARLERVLAHEEAHIRRGDWFSQLFLVVATAAMWPNPFVHVLAKRARALAEHAADDLVLASGAEPSCYASDLLEIARGSRATTPAFAIPMAAKPDVARRIEMILSKTRRRGAVTLPALIVSGLVLATIAVPVGSWAISQQQEPPQNVTGGLSVAGAPGAPGGAGGTGNLRGADIISIRVIQIKVPKGYALPGQKLASTAPGTEAYASVSAGDIERIYARASQDRTVVTAPMICAISGQKCAINTQVPSTGQKVTNTLELITATADAGYSVKLHLTSSAGERDDRVFGEIYGDVRLKEGYGVAFVQKVPLAGASDQLTILLPYRPAPQVEGAPIGAPGIGITGAGG